MAYDSLMNSEKHKHLSDIEDYIIDFGTKNDITCIGSYNPRNLNLSMEDFRDRYNLSPLGGDKFMKIIKLSEIVRNKIKNSD